MEFRGFGHPLAALIAYLVIGFSSAPLSPPTERAPLEVTRAVNDILARAEQPAFVPDAPGEGLACTDDAAPRVAQHEARTVHREAHARDVADVGDMREGQDERGATAALPPDGEPDVAKKHETKSARRHWIAILWLRALPRSAALAMHGAHLPPATKPEGSF